VAAVGLLGAAPSSAETAKEKQAQILKMRDVTIEELMKAKPEAKVQLEKSYGYAVFDTYGVMVVFGGGSGGSGVAVNNKTKKLTYMNAAQASVGFGLGGKDTRTVFIFNTQKAFDSFVNSGWEFGAQGTLQAQVAGKGGAIAGAEDLTKATIIYQLGKQGLMAEVNLGGTKYWKDKTLNK
jgi:lipid-binding SYLF domain-containing protein